MSTASELRKLAAIMFTDMVGYSTLSQRNEALALELLEEHRRLLRSLFPRFNGTEVKTIGDAFLVEFASALEAAQCAIEIQRTLAKRNTDAPTDRQIQVRIGIHIGDVIHREGDVLGDGVNIASRIEQLAGPSGICISMDVERQIRHALEASLVKLPAAELKNIAVPMDLFRIVLPWEKGEEVRSAKSEIRNRVSLLTSAATRTRWAAALIGLVLLTVGVGWWLVRHRGGGSPAAATAPAAPAKSVAVLPFVNLSSDKENEYLSDGLTEDLCTALTQVKGLRVPARTSCFVFKGKTDDIRKIGEQLSVATVLEGSVTKAGNKLRISAQLVEVANGFHLWATNYDREMADILEIRSDIARQVVTALKVQLGVDEAQRIVKKPTDNPEAYALCLQGHHWVEQGTKEGFTNAVRLFQQAVALDPQYALAYAGLARAYWTVSGWLLPSRTALAAAKTNAVTALRLDEALAEAHVALGLVRVWYDWDWRGGEVEFERALALAPNLADAHLFYAWYLNLMKRFDEARLASKRGWQLDPLSPLSLDKLVLVEFYARDYRQALELSRTNVAQFPQSIHAHFRLAWVCEQLGQYDEAISEMAKARSIDEAPDLMAGHAHIYAKAGQPAKAIGLLRQLEDWQKQAYVSPTCFAWVHLGLGQTNEAISRLQEGVGVRDEFLVELNVHPYFDPLRGDPRFTEILKQVGLAR